MHSGSFATNVHNMNNWLSRVTRIMLIDYWHTHVSEASSSLELLQQCSLL